MKTGEIIRILRLMKGVTQSHMVHVLNISQSAYSQKETAVLEFTIKECEGIVQELNLEMMDIFDFETKYPMKKE